MTKRALIVIAVLLLLPIVVILIASVVNAVKNPVVAEYGGRIDVIEYNGMTLHAVPGEDEYKFRFGEYLGKVSDRRYGASFYRVKDDATGGYYAISDGNKHILYTSTGALLDGVYDFVTPVTRVIVDDYAVVVEKTTEVALFSGLEYNERTEFDFKPSDHVTEDEEKLYVMYDLNVCYGGSAISTGNIGKLCYLTDEMTWVYLSNDVIKEANENIAADGIVYHGVVVKDPMVAAFFNETLRAGLPDGTTDMESGSDESPFSPSDSGASEDTGEESDSGVTDAVTSSVPEQSSGNAA